MRRRFALIGRRVAEPAIATPRQWRRRATARVVRFTLIELLVVIAIIAILSAQANGYGAWYEIQNSEPTNANFLTDDGAVKNVENMREGNPGVGGTTTFLVPGDYATDKP